MLFTSGMLAKFEVPAWVIFAAYGAIALGTMSGGWRVVHTMGARLTKLKPRSGFCAETAAAISILFATEYLQLPVSTTHVTAGAIAGVGSIQRHESGPLGRGYQYSLGVDLDDSCLGHRRLAHHGRDPVVHERELNIPAAPSRRGSSTGRGASSTEKPFCRAIPPSGGDTRPRSPFQERWEAGSYARAWRSDTIRSES